MIMGDPKFLSKGKITKNDICNYMLSEIESYKRPQPQPNIRRSKHYDDNINDYRKYIDTGSEPDDLDELDDVLQSEWDNQEEYEQRLRDIHDRYPDFDDRRAAFLGEDPETAERGARIDNSLLWW